jgi:hypothetical protein
LLACAPLRAPLERRENPGGQRRRAAPIEEDEELVEIDRRLGDKLSRQARLEAGRDEPAPAPLSQRTPRRRSSRV